MTGPAGRCGRSARLTSRPSSPTSPVTPRDELLAGTGADRPVVAMRVRASVGRPGGSAHARWRRSRAAEWAAWTRTLPWRIAVTFGIGVGGGVLGRLLAPRLSLVVGVLAATAAGWGLRFRPSLDAVAWRRGAAHRPTARAAGAARLGGPTRPGRPRQPGQPRPLGDRPRWGVRDRLQTVSRPLGARVIRVAVARPLPPRTHAPCGVLRARPGRPGPDRPRGGRGPDRGRPWRPGPLGQGCRPGCAGGGGRVAAKHAPPAPGGAGTRAVAVLADQARVRFHAAADPGGLPGGSPP